MSYDEDEIGSAGFGGGADEDAVLDDELLEPLEGITDFGLDEEDPDKDR